MVVFPHLDSLGELVTEMAHVPVKHRRLPHGIQHNLSTKRQPDSTEQPFRRERVSFQLLRIVARNQLGRPLTASAEGYRGNDWLRFPKWHF